MRDSKLYQQAKKETNKKRKKELFIEAETKYGFREYAISKFATMLMINEYSDLGSHIKIKLVIRAFNAVNKLRVGNAKHVNFIKYGEMYSIEGANNRQGIKYRDGNIVFNKLKIPIIIENNDLYAQKAIQDRVKYCRVIKKNIKGKYHYYLQLILEGVPPLKYNKETGEIRNYINEGKVGIDIGTQTIAICSENKVKLLELAPEINNIEKEKRIMQRKMDRSRRIMNPNKYNENNTCKKGDKDKWIKSNHYIKTQNELKEIQRKQKVIRKQSHEKLVNYILSLGDDIKVETMDYKSLQKRKKKSIRNKNSKTKSKKQFGKSIANKAPAMLLIILDNKLKWHDKKLYKVDTYSIKASQYNHITNKYKKKSLSERWNNFGDYKIQRDLYSAFLLMNVKDNLYEIDRELCFETFDKFKELHDIEIDRIKNCENKLISSMGI